MQDVVVCRFKYTDDEVSAVRKLTLGGPSGNAWTLDMAQWVLVSGAMALVMGAGIIGFLRLLMGDGHMDVDVPWTLTAWPALVISLALQVVIARRGEAGAGIIPDHPEQTARITREGIVLSNEYCETHYRWSAYASASQVNGTLILRDRSGTFLALPDRGFACAEDRARAWAVISERLQLARSRQQSS